MAPLLGLVKDAAPPASDTEVSPIVIPDGTTLLTTKQHNKIVDYLSGDAGPDFIPQNAIATLVADLAAKEDSLGFTPEDVSNKVTSIGTPGNNINYPTEAAVRAELDLKEDSLGFTPENVINKTVVFQVTPDDTKYPTEKLVKDSLDGKEDSLGFTPENIVNKGAVNGYAPLVTGLVPIVNLGTGTPDGTKFLRDDGVFSTPAGTGMGEVNTSSNSVIDSSTEKGLVLAKIGVDLPFRVIAIGSDNLSISSDSDKVTLDVLPANLSGIPQSGIIDLTTDLSNKQPIDSDLTAIAGLTPSNDDIIQRKSSAWVSRTPSQFKVDLSLIQADVGLDNVDNTSDADKPVSTAQQTALDGKEDSLGFTPEDIANKGAVNGYAGLDASQKLLLTNFPSGIGLQVLRRNTGNTALEFATLADLEGITSINGDGTTAQIIAGTANRISLVDVGATHTFDIDATYVGQASITTLGTITTGIWQGTVIASAFVATTLTGKTFTTAIITQPVLTLTQSATPTPTAEGVIEWDTDNNRIVVGDGTSTLLFSDDTVVENRSNHTGTQLASTISDFDSAVAATASVTANTAKVTNQTHSGDVTGSIALTIASAVVTVAMLANGTDGELITWDAAGVAATVAVGTSGQVLTSNGAGAAPTFQTAVGGSQTPILQDVDYDNFNISNLRQVTFDGTASGLGTATTNYIQSNVDGMILNAPVSKSFNLKINNVDEYTFNLTELDLHDNSILNADHITTDAVVTATTGVFRMNDGQTLAWRNSSNTENNLIEFNSDQFFISFDTAFTFQFSPTSFGVINGVNFSFGTGVGTKIGTTITQKIAFWNAPPIVQPAHIADPTGGATVDAEARTAINSILAQLASTGLQASV